MHCECDLLRRCCPGLRAAGVRVDNDDDATNDDDPKCLRHVTHRILSL